MQTYLRAEYLARSVQLITAYWKISPDFSAVGDRLVRLADADDPPDLLIPCIIYDGFLDSSPKLLTSDGYFQWSYRLQ